MQGHYVSYRNMKIKIFTADITASYHLERFILISLSTRYATFFSDGCKGPGPCSQHSNCREFQAPYSMVWYKYYQAEVLMMRNVQYLDLDRKLLEDITKQLRFGINAIQERQSLVFPLHVHSLLDLGIPHSKVFQQCRQHFIGQS